MPLNREFLQDFLSLRSKTEEMKKEIDAKIKQVLEEKIKYEGKSQKYNALSYVDYGTETIQGSVVYRSKSWCSDDDYESFSFPTDFLFRDDWEKELQKLVTEEKRMLELEEIKRREEEKKIWEEEERKEWERLNQKYGENGECLK